MRGLKQDIGRKQPYGCGVAPYVGAWIETFISAIVASMFLSHPTWVRGLKLIGESIRKARQAVAPYVGAWIETSTIVLNSSIVSSHPTWVRGLKLDEIERAQVKEMSHPTWVRGLKLNRAKSSNKAKGRTLRGCVD